MPNTLVIVGAGFCGTVLAANLLRRPPSGRDRHRADRARLGDGTRHGVRRIASFPYLFNVPAARLSADSADPLQFLRFAQRRQPDVDGEDFLPRALYGEYLQEVLLQAERSAPSAHSAAASVRRSSPHRAARAAVQPLIAEFADREPIAADRVILALGNPPPAPLPWAAAIRDHAAYRHAPLGTAEDVGGRALGAHRRQWIDHGRCRLGIEPGCRAHAPRCTRFPGAAWYPSRKPLSVRPRCGAMARRSWPARIRCGGCWP